MINYLLRNDELRVTNGRLCLANSGRQPSALSDGVKPMNAAHARKLENMYLAAPISRLYEPTIRVSEGAAEIAIAVAPTFFHSAGALHGSVYFKMLDDACFFAVSSLVEEVFVLTTSFTTYLTRPVTCGRLTANGCVVHAGKMLYLAEAVLVGDDGGEVARGNGAFMKSRIALTAEIGYRDGGAE
jgi:uncharacterized protein (TIGR00369 family)